MTKARAVPMPGNSVLAPLYAGADLLDAFAIRLPAGASDDLEVLARAGFERPAGWIRALTRIRDVVMAKSASNRRAPSVLPQRGVGRLSATSRCCQRARRSWLWARMTRISTSASRSNFAPMQQMGASWSWVRWCIAIID